MLGFLRIEFHESSSTINVRVLGQFAGKLAEDARDLITLCRKLPNLVVNLSEVSFVDSTGEEVLSCFGQLGVKFIAENPHSLHVCEHLHLPMLVRPSGTLHKVVYERSGASLSLNNK